MKGIAKIGLPLTVLAIVGAFAVVLATTNITPAAAQSITAPVPEPRESPLSAVRGILDRALNVVESPEELLSFLGSPEELLPR